MFRMWGIICCLAFGVSCAGQQGSSPRESVGKTAALAVGTAHPTSAGERAFVLGRAAFDQGRWDAAVQRFDQAVRELATIADYGWYYLGTAAWKTKAYPAAQRAFSAIFNQYPDSPFRAAAVNGLLKIALATGDLAAAERLLVPMAALPAPPQIKRVLQQRLALHRAELHWLQGHPFEARTELLTLYRNAPYLGDATAIRMRLQRLQGGGDPFRFLGSAERVALARHLLERDQASEAVRVLQPVANQGAEAQAWYAQALFAARAYKRATGQLALVVQRNSELALLQKYASAAVRSDQFDLALQVQAQIATQFAGRPEAREARYKQAFILFDAGRFAEARTAYRAWLDAERPSAAERRDTAWKIFWCDYFLHDWPAARRDVHDLNDPVRGSYWQARVLEQAGESAMARSLYESLVGSGGYYGHLAMARLRGGSAAVTKLFQHARQRGGVAGAPPDAPTERAQVLLRLGLWDMAIDEADRATGAPTFGPDHRWAIAQWGARWGIAPAVVQALIRQESAFRVDVVSPAGAVGLMQLMPKTARAMARSLGLSDYHETDLYRPVPNLRLGLWYLRSLLLRYQGHLPYVLASYNAGEAAVDRWVARSPARAPDEFVDNIPYRETHEYVKKILSNVW